MNNLTKKFIFLSILIVGGIWLFVYITKVTVVLPTVIFITIILTFVIGYIKIMVLKYILIPKISNDLEKHIQDTKVINIQQIFYRYLYGSLFVMVVYDIVLTQFTFSKYFLTLLGCVYTAEVGILGYLIHLLRKVNDLTLYVSRFLR